MADKRVFNSELAIKLRNENQLTQNELVNRLTEKTKEFEISFSISMRTIRDLENKQPVDVEKGVFIFRELGHKHTEEIYSPDDQPEILPLLSLEIFTKYHELRPIEVEYIPGKKNIWDQLSSADRYYLHLGDVNEQLEPIILEFLKLIDQRGEIVHRKTTEFPDRFINHRLKISKFNRLVNEGKLGVYSITLTDHYTIFKGISEDHAWREMSVFTTGPEEDEPEKYPAMSDLFESEYAGPHSVVVIGVTSSEDKNLRVDHWTGRRILLVRSNFSEADLLDFSNEKIDYHRTQCPTKDGEGAAQLIDPEELRGNGRFSDEKIGVNVKDNFIVVNEVVVKNVRTFIRRGVWDSLNYEKYKARASESGSTENYGDYRSWLSRSQ
jgi:hypothetical protein